MLALAVGLLGAGGRQRKLKKKDGERGLGVPAVALEALRHGNLTRAWSEAERHLKGNPFQSPGWAVMGGVESLLGWYPEAVSAFEGGQQAIWYDRVGRPLHADALRSVGRADEAAALRRESLEGEARPAARLRAYADLVDDLRYAGDALGAEAVVAEAMGQYPRSSVAMSLASDLALDRGDVEEAESWLALIEHFAGRVHRTLLVELRLAVMVQDHDRVDRIMGKLARTGGSDPVANALLAHSLCDRGEAEEALDAARAAPGRGDVVTAAAEVRALRMLGEEAEARVLASWLLARHPEHPELAWLE